MITPAARTRHAIWMSIAVIGPLVIGLLNAPPTRAQSPAAPAGHREFEVASIKPSPSGMGDRGFSARYEHGRFTASNAGLLSLIKMAYQVKDYQVSGAPGWLNEARFDILASAPPNTPDKFGELMPMLQTLLVDRFKLTFHRESKVVQGYALVVSKTGSKLRPSTDEETGLTGGKGSILRT